MHSVSGSSNYRDIVASKLIDSTTPFRTRSDSPSPATMEDKLSLLKTPDGLELSYQFWSGAKGAPVLLYLHGIEGHSKWFKPTAEALSQVGIATYALDRRGSGANQINRGHLDSYRQVLSDYHCMLQTIQARHTENPIFLMGNCWGAQVAILMAAELAQTGITFAGLILTSPALSVKCDVDLLTKLQIAFCWLVRSMKLFDLPLTPDMFTDNPVFLDYVKQDPLRLTTATASFLIESLKLRHKAMADGVKLTMPLLVLQSGCDQIVEEQAVSNWFETVPSRDKNLKVFETMAHSLDFDQNSEPYLQLLISWILQHTVRSPK